MRNAEPLALKDVLRRRIGPVPDRPPVKRFGLGDLLFRHGIARRPVCMGILKSMRLLLRKSK